MRAFNAGDSEAMFLAALPEPVRPLQFAQAGAEPITVPRPAADQTVTIGVITGRPLKLEFTVTDVKDREVVRDDLVLSFDNGGKVVLKDYMHAFGMLGEHRTTIIQPDGKHYAFTELLAPTAGPGAEKPAPGTSPDVVIIQKPHAGETQHFKLTAEKPMALNFGMGEIARSEVNKDGDLVLTFKDHGVLVLQGYAALKGSADVALYFAKGDKIALADLAPGAGPEGSEEGGHLFTSFAPGGTIGPLDHLGALGPEPFSLIPPPGPPGSPPGSPPPPPGSPPPPPFSPPPPPPEVCKPPPKDCMPPHDCRPPPKDCEPPPHHKHVKDDCRPPPICEPRDHGKDHGPKEHHDPHHKLTWVAAPGCDVAGDAHWAGGRWGEHDGGRMLAEHGHRGWSDGHDGSHMTHSPQLAHGHDNVGGWIGGDMGGTYGAGAWHDGHSGDHAALSGLHHSGHDPQGGTLSAQHVFDHGAQGSSPAHAGDYGHVAAHDFGAFSAHAESHAPQVQNHAQHNVMGHG